MAGSCLLYYITDRTALAADEPARRRRLLEKIAEAARAGVDYIQLREKDLPTRELESLAREAVRAIRKARKLATGNRQLATALLINSRTDVALAVEAGGVHLRSDDVSALEVRTTWEKGHVGTAAPGRPAGRSPAAYDADVHYSYEDEDQSASWKHSGGQSSRQKPTAPAKPYNSIENIAEFFASRGKKFTVPKAPLEEPTGKRGFRPGQKVRHPKYGEGTVYLREGEGEEAKITVQFPRFGLKKLVEKYAQLERA